MTKTEFKNGLEQLTRTAGETAEVALLCRELGADEPIYAWRSQQMMRSASLIKVPMLLAILELVMQGDILLDDMLAVRQEEILEKCVPFEGGPRDASVEELLNWMTILSDNTATNVLLQRVGTDAVNAYSQKLGLENTHLRRKMRDLEAIRAGRDNHTSADDMYRLFEQLCGGEVLNREMREKAMDMLLRQRDGRYMKRYLWEGVHLAHKTGTQDGLSHDAGVFFVNGYRVFVGAFVQNAKDIKGDMPYLGRVGRLVMDYYSGLPQKEET